MVGSVAAAKAPGLAALGEGLSGQADIRRCPTPTTPPRIPPVDSGASLRAGLQDHEGRRRSAARCRPLTQPLAKTGPSRLHPGLGKTSKITRKLVSGQGLLSIRWAGWNPAAHLVKGVHRVHRIRCTITLCTPTGWNVREWRPLRRAPVERAVRGERCSGCGAVVRWLGVHGIVGGRAGASDAPHRAHRMPGCSTLPTGWSAPSGPPDPHHRGLPSAHGARWSPPCPLIPGDGPARYATRSAGRRGTAVMGAGRVAASATGTAPYAAGPRRRTAPGACAAPAKGAAGSGQP